MEGKEQNAKTMTWSAEDIPDTSEGLVFETTKMLVGFMLALNLTEEHKIQIITGMVVDGADEDRQWKNIQKLREQLAGREKPTSERAYLEAQKVIRAAGFVEEAHRKPYLEAWRLRCFHEASAKHGWPNRRQTARLASLETEDRCRPIESEGSLRRFPADPEFEWAKIF
jgi:hypothetical protein